MQNCIKKSLILCLLLSLIFPIINNSTIQAQSNITSEDIVLKKLPAYADTDFEGIVIKVLVNKEDVVYGFEVSGHSRYAEKGKDIVCAGISTIAQNTLISIKSYTNDKIESNINNGYLKCILPEMKNGYGSEKACVLLKSAIMGFYLIQESSYGTNYVKVFKQVD